MVRVGIRTCLARVARRRRRRLYVKKYYKKYYNNPQRLWQKRERDRLLHKQLRKNPQYRKKAYAAAALWYKKNKRRVKLYNLRNKEKQRRKQHLYYLKNKKRIVRRRRSGWLSYYKKHTKKIARAKRLYNRKNALRVKQRKRAYYAVNKDKVQQYKRKYCLKNKERIRVYRRNYCRRSHKYKITKALRNRLRDALRRTHNVKTCSPMLLLGCTISFFREHIAARFVQGMTWDNYGDWHLDHIRPCASFDLSKGTEQHKCFHYSNMQPLWAKDNLAKGARFYKEAA